MKRNSNSVFLSPQKALLPTRRQLSSLSDKDLLSQAQVGDQEAFEQLVERYRTILLHFIIHIIGNQDEAHDILQQVLIRFYLSLPTLSETQSIKPWLFRVAQNCSIDVFRKKSRHPTVPFSHLEQVDEEKEYSFLEAIADPSASPEEQIEQQEQYNQLQHAIVHLPQHFREVVILRCQENLRFKEVASQLHMPESTVKTYYRRAQRLLCTMIAS